MQVPGGGGAGPGMPGGPAAPPPGPHKVSRPTQPTDPDRSHKVLGLDVLGLTLLLVGQSAWRPDALGEQGKKSTR